MSRFRVLSILAVCVAPLFVGGTSSFLQAHVVGSEAQRPLERTIDAFLAPAYPYELVSAKAADRIAWIAYERGRRNVYTAAAPAFRPLKLTRHLEDDGIDLTSLRISDDGSVVVFVRGHQPNREGWVANPASSPDGARRMIWAARTAGGAAWRVAEGAEPALSPDGRFVLYVDNGQIFRARVSAVPGARSAAPPKPFITAFGENGDPVWSPDGSRIAFVSERGDHSLVVVYDVRSKAITYVAPSVDRDSSPTWSPDGSRIAFIRRPGSTFAQIIAQNAAGGRGQGRGIQGGGRAGRGAQTEEGPQIPGLTRAVFKGGYTLSFWVADVKGGPVVASSDESLAREFWHNAPADTAFARVTTIRWAGDRVVFQAEPQEWIRYYSVPIAGPTAPPIELTPGDGMVETVSFSSDGRELFYSTNAGDIDRRHVWKVPTAGGQAVRITSGADIETYPAVLASGKQVALLSAAAARPQSVALAPTTGGAVKVIFPTPADSFPAADHVSPENVTLTADDGVKFNNQLFVPKGLRPGERRPALIFVHGGPQRQMLLGYHYRHFYHMAYGVNQWLASQGYVVLSVNYRSGIGYGRSFRMAPNTGQRGSAEYRDVLAAGKYLQGRADVDPKRVGIWGLSYGGILTAQALARNSDIFIAGVDLAGVHLWGNSLDRDSVAYQSSAISHIDTWKSPVLLVHGDDDRNVAFSQTTGLVQLLRARDIYHELIVFPDDVHDSLLYSRWIYTFERMDKFLEKFMGTARKIGTE